MYLPRWSLTENDFNANWQRDDAHSSLGKQLLQGWTCTKSIHHDVDLDKFERNFALDCTVLHVLRGTSSHWHYLATNSPHAQRSSRDDPCFKISKITWSFRSGTSRQTRLLIRRINGVGAVQHSCSDRFFRRRKQKIHATVLRVNSALLVNWLAIIRCLVQMVCWEHKRLLKLVDDGRQCFIFCFRLAVHHLDC